MIFYLLTFFLTFLLVIMLTTFFRWLALRYKIIDRVRSVPLLGGIAIFLSFFAVLIGIYFLTRRLPTSYFLTKHLVGIFIAGGFLMIGGFLDDKYQLKPYQQVIWPILAVLAIIVSGIGIQYVNNPFGEGFLHLDQYKIEVLRIDGIPYYFTVIADIFTFVWLLSMTYTTKLLDGLDGLVSGIVIIGGVVMFFLGLKMGLPSVAIISLILAASFAGFLLFNFHPAKIFLGEGGSLFAGFMLGILGIIGGGKVATTLLIVGIPVLDVVWVIFRRLFQWRRSPFLADKRHLHFRLLGAGFSHRGAVIFLWGISLVFGTIALFLQTMGKVIALVSLGTLMVILALFLVLGSKKSQSKI